ncbi:LysR family transcriptional regulator [Streptomyces sp. NRRL F-4489]|uniref:LysR family transcriptional regulator n=1 Tax=Streptomyces sp. NRRL F-4489 TaxID=1609095 RepID=UPI00074819EC|nr:LysR family transcriptional regulator [Streptomyces sp. NRRL F-4489]KUL49643.1 LysR family transcriptional regulator [Streptomyces sp. NRRL F-4489]
MELNLHQLWIFMQVIEHQGFSAAAQKLYMSQPAVSNQVRRLEQALRVTLIDRTGTRVRPTAEGALLAAYGERVLRLADEAVAAVQEAAEPVTGRLLVGGSTTVGTYLLPALLARYQRRHPDVGCEVFVGDATAVTERLRTGGIGLAVVAGRPPGDQLAVEQVLDERLLLIAAPDHPLAGTDPVTPHDLAAAGARFLLREPGSPARARQERALADWGLAGAPRADIWGPETAKRCAAAGMGLALLPEHAVAGELRAGTLTALPVTPAPPSCPVSLVRHRDRPPSRAERAFLAVLRELRDRPAEPGAEPLGAAAADRPCRC